MIVRELPEYLERQTLKAAISVVNSRKVESLVKALSLETVSGGRLSRIKDDFFE
jgi:hypothetical protein